LVAKEPPEAVEVIDSLAFVVQQQDALADVQKAELVFADMHQIGFQQKETE
jgi:hypothetical protein